MMGKCDMNECSEMTKEECAAKCDSLGCSADEKAACLSHYDADGNFQKCEKQCCQDKNACCEGKAKGGECTDDCEMHKMKDAHGHHGH